MSEQNTPRIKRAFERHLLEILEQGVPLTDGDGNLVLDENGEPERRRPTHQELSVIRAYLKDAGAEHEDTLTGVQPGATAGALDRFKRAFEVHGGGRA